MKRITSLVLAFVMLLSTMGAVVQAESVEGEGISPDFKSFYWGDSKEAIMAIEGEPYADGEVDGVDATYIAYQTTAVGLDMLLGYYFCEDGLYQVRYVLTETHSNESRYIEDYETFREALEKKYGEPLLDNEYWSNDNKKKYYADDKGNALCYGYLTYSTIWLLDRTYIAMEMSADNYEISMVVDYASAEISPGEADYSDEV